MMPGQTTPLLVSLPQAERNAERSARMQLEKFEIEARVSLAHERSLDNAQALNQQMRAATALEQQRLVVDGEMEALALRNSQAAEREYEEHARGLREVREEQWRKAERIRQEREAESFLEASVAVAKRQMLEQEQRKYAAVWRGGPVGVLRCCYPRTRGGRPGPVLVCDTPQPPPPPRVSKDSGARQDLPPPIPGWTPPPPQLPPPPHKF